MLTDEQLDRLRRCAEQYPSLFESSGIVAVLVAGGYVQGALGAYCYNNRGSAVPADGRHQAGQPFAPEYRHAPDDMREVSPNLAFKWPGECPTCDTRLVRMHRRTVRSNNQLG